MSILNKHTTLWGRSLLLIWVFLFGLMFNIPQNIEGKLFPVVSDFTVGYSVPKETGLHFFGRFEKLRDCSFDGIVAYQEHDNRWSRIRIRFDDRAVIRETGSADYGPWFMQTDNLHEVSIYAEHYCHPLWKTKTRLK